MIYTNPSLTRDQLKHLDLSWQPFGYIELVGCGISTSHPKHREALHKRWNAPFRLVERYIGKLLTSAPSSNRNGNCPFFFAYFYFPRIQKKDVTFIWELRSWIVTGIKLDWDCDGDVHGVPNSSRQLRTKKTSDLSGTTFILILITVHAFSTSGHHQRASIYLLLYLSHSHQLATTFPDLEVQRSEP